MIYTANVSTAQLAKEIAAYSSLSTGDVKNTLDNLVTVSAQHLQASESVTLDGFGTFRMVMKSNGKGVEVPEKVSAAQASLTVRIPGSRRISLAVAQRVAEVWLAVQESGYLPGVPGSPDHLHSRYLSSER